MLLGSFIAAAVGGRFFPHYFVLMLPFLAIAAALGAAKIERTRLRRLVWALMAVLLAADIRLQKESFVMPADELLADLYGRSPFYQSPAVGKYLRGHAKPGATVYILGSEGQILFYSGLRCPTRLFFFYPLKMPSPLRDEFRRELLSSLKAHPPDFFLLVNSFSSHTIKAGDRDPFIAELLRLFSPYRLNGVSLSGSSEVAVDYASLMGALREKPADSILILSRPAEGPARLQRPSARR